MAKAWRDAVIDPVTRQVVKGRLTLEPTGDLEIWLPYRLESPNAQLHAHWRARTATKKAWHRRLLSVLADAAGRSSVADLARPLDAIGLVPVTERRRVRVTRLVPSARNFIRDRDNLVYSVKPLLDQIKKLGFLRDDSSAWTTLEEPVQRVSDDKRDWTVIRIEVPPGATVPLSARAAAEALLGGIDERRASDGQRDDDGIGRRDGNPLGSGGSHAARRRRALAGRDGRGAGPGGRDGTERSVAGR